MRPLTVPELDQLPPHRLDSYRRKLLSLEESVALSDLDESAADSLDASLIYFKDDSRWTEQMQRVQGRLRSSR